MNKDRIKTFADTVYADMAGAMAMAMAYIGVKKGIFHEMAGKGPMTKDMVAAATGLHHRYIEEWLFGMTTGGYLEHDPEAATFTLPVAPAAALRGFPRSPPLAGRWPNARDKRWLSPIDDDTRLRRLILGRFDRPSSEQRSKFSRGHVRRSRCCVATPASAQRLLWVKSRRAMSGRLARKPLKRTRAVWQTLADHEALLQVCAAVALPQFSGRAGGRSASARVPGGSRS